VSSNGRRTERAYNYCPNCGQPLQRKTVNGRERPACAACGFVYFADPKVAVSVLLAQEGRVLLVRRAVVPRIGYWALPAGFVDAGELPQETAVREVREETGLEVALNGLLTIQPIANPDKQGFLMMYRGHVLSGTLRAQDDVSEARWFTPGEIPWNDLAFETTNQVLRHWLQESAEEVLPHE
jgi:ADP-ribose pyrophosphatase YjhB (NUDIX family)